ncbi:uncharacterized protein J8A68_005703 [[Candida] subhashii]|uniref:Methyltransferase type 11 domain-containing protein n=1 Tax=[Candida] subhashii TaxID=561895 RepID=A0A8J5Q5G9_9ASCO|nr:uncharacterized protein J8A68_005703 [[Candida] subhashii]KAG7660741.1 hypothetical protein J8A68_005703 [[Candida] subhashii]
MNPIAFYEINGVKHYLSCDQESCLLTTDLLYATDFTFDSDVLMADDMNVGYPLSGNYPLALIETIKGAILLDYTLDETKGVLNLGGTIRSCKLTIQRENKVTFEGGTTECFAIRKFNMVNSTPMQNPESYDADGSENEILFEESSDRQIIPSAEDQPEEKPFQIPESATNVASQQHELEARENSEDEFTSDEPEYSADVASDEPETATSGNATLVEPETSADADYSTEFTSEEPEYSTDLASDEPESSAHVISDEPETDEPETSDYADYSTVSTSEEPEYSTDLASDEPETLIDTTSDEPEYSTDVPSDEPETSIDATSDEAEYSTDVASDEPETLINPTSEEPEYSTDVASDEPQTSVDATFDELETSVDATSDEPETSDDSDYSTVSTSGEPQYSTDATSDEQETSIDATTDEQESSANTTSDEPETSDDSDYSTVSTSGEPQYSTDATSDEQETSIDATTDEQESSANTTSDEPETSDDSDYSTVSTSGEPQYSTDATSDEQETSIDATTDEQESSANTTSDEPDTSVIVTSDEPEISENADYSTDAALDEPESSANTTSDEPETSVIVTLDEPETSEDADYSTDAALDEPESSANTTSDEPESSANPTSDEPETSAIVTSDEPEISEDADYSTDAVLDEPESSANTTSDEPESSAQFNPEEPESSVNESESAAQATSDEPETSVSATSDEPESSNESTSEESSAQATSDEPESSVMVTSDEPESSSSSEEASSPEIQPFSSETTTEVTTATIDRIETSKVVEPTEVVPEEPFTIDVVVSEEELVFGFNGTHVILVEEDEAAFTIEEGVMGVGIEDQYIQVQEDGLLLAVGRENASLGWSMIDNQIHYDPPEESGLRRRKVAEFTSCDSLVYVNVEGCMSLELVPKNIQEVAPESSAVLEFSTSSSISESLSETQSSSSQTSLESSTEPQSSSSESSSESSSSGTLLETESSSVQTTSRTSQESSIEPQPTQIDPTRPFRIWGSLKGQEYGHFAQNGNSIVFGSTYQEITFSIQNTYLVIADGLYIQNSTNGLVVTTSKEDASPGFSVVDGGIYYNTITDGNLGDAKPVEFLVCETATGVFVVHVNVEEDGGCVNLEVQLENTDENPVESEIESDASVTTRHGSRHSLAGSRHTDIDVDRTSVSVAATTSSDAVHSAASDFVSTTDYIGTKPKSSFVTITRQNTKTVTQCGVENKCQTRTSVYLIIIETYCPVVEEEFITTLTKTVTKCKDNTCGEVIEESTSTSTRTSIVTDYVLSEINNVGNSINLSGTDSGSGSNGDINAESESDSGSAGGANSGSGSDDSDSPSNGENIGSGSGSESNGNGEENVIEGAPSGSISTGSVATDDSPEQVGDYYTAVGVDLSNDAGRSEGPTLAAHNTAVTSFNSNHAEYDVYRPSFTPVLVNPFLAELGLAEQDQDGEFKFKTEKVILELAAGTGKFTHNLIKNGWGSNDENNNLIIVEPSSGMLDSFKSNFPDLKNVHQGDSYKLPVGDSTVDVIIIAQAFHWFADLESLAELNRVLKPDGKLGLIWNFDYSSPSQSGLVADAKFFNDNSLYFDKIKFEEYEKCSELFESYFDNQKWNAEVTKYIYSFDQHVPQYRHGKWRPILERANPFFGSEIKDLFVFYDKGIKRDEVWKYWETRSYITELGDEDKERMKKHVEESIDILVDDNSYSDKEKTILIKPMGTHAVVLNVKK